MCIHISEFVYSPSSTIVIEMGKGEARNVGELVIISLADCTLEASSHILHVQYNKSGLVYAVENELCTRKYL